MRKKSVEKGIVRIDAFEARYLLSVNVQPVTVPDGSSSSVQAVAELYPTYEAFNLPGELTPDLSASPQGYTPSEIRTAYGLNQVTFGSTTGDGSGQTIAIIDAYNDPTIKADLLAFDSAFGLQNSPLTVVSQTGSTSNLPPVDPSGAGSNDWEGEESLDVEWAHAMAPGASIILVEAGDSSPSNLFAAANWARQQAGVSVISMSFGGNETGSETQYDSIFTTPSGHQGVTFVASTGDAGAPSGFPSLSANLVATGGTGLAVDSVGNYQSETGWSGSGGGISDVESQPSYQKGVVTQSTTFRTNPDVAFDADPSTGVSIYDSYDNGTKTPWEIVGGTSLAAPSWAGIFAVADQGRVLAGEGTLDSRTQTLPLLYSAPASDFHDITTGNNGYSARSGYDLVTGLGSPKTNLLIPFLVSGTVVSPPPPPPSSGPTIASITASDTTVTEGTSLTLTANGVSDPNRSGLTLIFYEETNNIAGLQTSASNGDYAFTPVTDGSNAIVLDTTDATGTFTFYAQLTDSTGAASSSGTGAQSVTVTIVAPSGSGPSISSITAQPSPVVSGDTLTLTANGVSDPQTGIRRVYFYQDTNGIAGLQTGLGGDFAFRPVTASSGYSLALDTTGVSGPLTFYALAVDNFGNTSSTGTAAPTANVNVTSNVVPAAPTNLVATAKSSSEIDLTFAEDDTVQTGFTIERALNPAFTNVTRLFTINRPNVLSYSDTGLTVGTRYYYRVQAFDDAGNGDFSNTANAITGLPATHLVIAQQPASAMAGHLMKPALVIDLENAKNQIVTGDDSIVTIAIATGAKQSTLHGTKSIAAVNGVATFSNLSLLRAVKYTLTVSDGGLTTARTSAISVSADASTARLVLAQPPANSAANKRLTPLILDVEDAYGNLLTSDDPTVVVTIVSGPSGGVLEGTVKLVASHGVADFAKLWLNKKGTYTLRGAASKLPDPTPVAFAETIT